MENICIDFEFEKLEFRKITEKISEYSYLSHGREKILETVPYFKKEEIIYNFQLIDELKNFLTNEERLNLSKIFNVGEYSTLARKKSILTAVNLYETGSTLKNYFYLKKRFSNLKYAKLSVYFTVLDFKDNFYLDILKYIKEDGYIESKASRELAEARGKISEIEEKIKKATKDFYLELKNSGYASDEIISVRDGFQCVALKSNYKSRVEGAILDYS
ncbi:MAG TPA: hypothetical protein PLO89_03865, partial [Spirochaetota bacterium]|nr:hypothetical protein [Spirochaetota bacterium]